MRHTEKRPEKHCALPECKCLIHSISSSASAKNNKDTIEDLLAEKEHRAVNKLTGPWRARGHAALATPVTTDATPLMLPSGAALLLMNGRHFTH